MFSLGLYSALFLKPCPNIFSSISHLWLSWNDYFLPPSFLSSLSPNTFFSLLLSSVPLSYLSFSFFPFYASLLLYILFFPLFFLLPSHASLLVYLPSYLSFSFLPFHASFTLSLIFGNVGRANVPLLPPPTQYFYEYTFTAAQSWMKLTYLILLGRRSGIWKRSDGRFGTSCPPRTAGSGSGNTWTTWRTGSRSAPMRTRSSRWAN